MRRLTLIVGAALCMWCASIATSASAVEWGPPIAVPGMHGAFTSRVAISRYDAVAVASDWEYTGYVVVRYPEGRWTAVRKLGGPSTLVSSPDVAFDARGRLLLVWTQARRQGSRGFAYKGPFEVMAQTWTEAKGWGAVKTMGPAKNFILAQPRLAVNPRGDAILAWRGYRRSGRRIVEAVSTSFRPAEHGWQPIQQPPGGGPYRDVTLDAKGNAYAVWTTYAGPRNYFSMRPRQTGGWGSARRLPGLPASLPTVAANPDGAAVIAWRAAIGDSEGEGTQYGPPRAIVRFPTGHWSKVHVLSTVRTHEVSAALAPNGTILLSWGPLPIFGPNGVPGQTDVRFSLFSRSQALSPQRRAPATGLGPIAYRPNDDALLVFGPESFEGFNPRAQGPIRFAALVQREPTFSEPVAIVAHGGYPSLATPPTGVGPVEAAMSWYQESGKRIELSLLTRGPLEPRP
jgi:hypothetical protein